MFIENTCRIYTNYYRPHPKDGEGNVFSLFTPGGGVRSVQPGGGQVSPAGGGVRSVQPGVGQVSPAGGVGQSSRGSQSSQWGGGGSVSGGGEHLAPSCGRYASCVHTGGLSCLSYKTNQFLNFLENLSCFYEKGFTHNAINTGVLCVWTFVLFTQVKLKNNYTWNFAPQFQNALKGSRTSVKRNLWIAIRFHTMSQMGVE